MTAAKKKWLHLPKHLRRATNLPVLMLSQREQDILFQTNMVKIYSVFETTKTPHKPYAAHTCKAHTREYPPGVLQPRSHGLFPGLRVTPRLDPKPGIRPWERG